MDPFTASIRKASKNFCVSDGYDFRHEFANRNYQSGIYMPLTMYCAKLDVDFYMRSGRNSYARMEAVIKGRYELTNLGKLKLQILKEMDNFERTTCGTIALWGFRENERKRQLAKVEHLSKDFNWNEPRKVYQEHLEELMEKVYFMVLNSAKEYLMEILQDRDEERILTYINKFIGKYDKHQISMMSKERYPYYHILEGHVKILEAIEEYIKLIDYILENFYSILRLNPIYILSALRNRPLELINIDENGLNGWMDRSREANGQPPLSLLWMFIFEIKEKLYKLAIGALESVWGIKIFDPIRDKDFYWRFTHFNDGLYMFGDNGLVIKGGKIVVMYDLSISDVYQGLLRRNEEGKNFCFFQRINEKYDCGSTGGAFTTVWNIDGQFAIWKAFEEGRLKCDEDWPHISDLCEKSSTFLGHYWNARMKRWMTLGLRLTKDNARKSVAFRVKRGSSNHLSWEQKEVNTAEFAQLVVSSGFGAKKLRKFYDWVRLKRLSIDPEEMGVTERIGEVAEKHIPEFLSLFKEESLVTLARPLELVG